MGLCWTTRSKHECRPKQLCLYLVYLFLRLEDGIDKFFVRELTVKMGLSHIVIYLEFALIKKFIAYPCPDMERWIPVVRHIDTDKFRPG